jgi:hypothetical protein
MRQRTYFSSGSHDQHVHAVISFGLFNLTRQNKIIPTTSSISLKVMEPLGSDKTINQQITFAHWSVWNISEEQPYQSSQASWSWA